MFSRYFVLLEETTKENKLDGKPRQIFNMDESAISLILKALSLLLSKAIVCFASCVTIRDKAQITIVACISVPGFSLLSMVMWDSHVHLLSPELTIEEVLDTI